jgi:hypothetical protein
MYRAALSSGKEMLVRVTWPRSAAGAASVAVAFDEGVSPLPPSRKSQLVLQKRRGSRSLVIGAGTVVGVRWDTGEAKYPADSCAEPAGGYCLVVVADGELSRRFGSAILVNWHEQLRGAAAAHATRCRFRDGAMDRGGWQ